MTQSHKAMNAYLNFHTHRTAVSPQETVIHNLLPFPPEKKGSITGNEWFSTGIHPWHIPEDLERAFTELETSCRSRQCAILGEMGLDKCTDTPFALQREVFVRQLKLAESHQLPVVIHCVRAWSELLEIQKKVHPTIPCVIHGFRGAPALARQLLDKGFYLSFGFRFQAQSLILCPSDRLFLETDEDNRSVEELYKEAAAARGCSMDALGLQCLDNLRQINPFLVWPSNP